MQIEMVRNEQQHRQHRSVCTVTKCLGLAEIVPVLALKIPHPRKPLHPRQTGTLGQPKAGPSHRPQAMANINSPAIFMFDAYICLNIFASK